MLTTYIIGAGASHAVWNFPLLKGFLADCHSQIRALTRGGEGSDLAQYLGGRFDNFRKQNLEDLLGDLDNTLFGLGGMWNASSTNPRRLTAFSARMQLLQVITERLSVDRKPKPSLEPYRRVLGGYQPNDTIITFNYDMGIEQYADAESLTLVNSEMTSNWVSSGTIPRLLKLHGSANFLTCENPHCPTWYKIHCPGPTLSIRGGFCNTCGGSLQSLIVPPSINKSFERYPALASFWRAAQAALVESERLVIWGFSCPPSDHSFAWLLRNAYAEWDFMVPPPLREIHIIDPNCESVVDNLKGIIDPFGIPELEWKSVKSHTDFTPC